VSNPIRIVVWPTGNIGKAGAPTKIELA